MSTPYHKQYKNNNPTLDWFDNDKYSGLHGLDDVAIYKLLKRRAELLSELLKATNSTPTKKAAYFLVAGRKKFEFITNDPLASNSTIWNDLMDKILGDIKAKGKYKTPESDSELKENIVIDDIDLDLAIKGASYDEPVNGFGVDDDGCAFYTLYNLFEDGEWEPETRSYIEFTPEMFVEEFDNVVKVNLYAPESEIRDSFNRWLKEAQKKVGAVKKPSFLVEKNSLIKHKVLQYLDLWTYGLMDLSSVRRNKVYTL